MRPSWPFLDKNNEQLFRSGIWPRFPGSGTSSSTPGTSPFQRGWPSATRRGFAPPEPEGTGNALAPAAAACCAAARPSSPWRPPGRVPSAQAGHWRECWAEQSSDQSGMKEVEKIRQPWRALWVKLSNNFYWSVSAKDGPWRWWEIKWSVRHRKNKTSLKAYNGYQGRWHTFRRLERSCG